MKTNTDKSHLTARKTKVAPPARTKPKLTPWFPPSAKPARVGWYQFLNWLVDGRAMNDEGQMAWWGGRKWFYRHGSFPVSAGSLSQWRGLASNPARSGK